MAGSVTLKTVVMGKNVASIGSSAFTRSSAVTDYFCFKGTRGDTFWGTASTKHYMGDMDGDKAFTPQDFGALVNAALDKTNLTSELLEIVADCNMDGTVDALDCRLVKLLSQGKDLPA